jgi:uncharacterized membrane protein YhaH (DUF805 family)
MSKLFTMDGRITRQQYILWTLGVSAVTFILAFMAGFMIGMTSGTSDAAGVLGFIIGLAGALVQSFLVVRRLHDIGKPGWHYWLFFVPLYNLYLGLILLFTPGDSGNNEYGNNPASA